MKEAYDALIKTGAIGSLKRDILLEASDDIEYLCHIQKWFNETAGAEAAKVATACTVRVVRELIAKKYCKLATWGKEKEPFDIVTKTEEELFEIVDKYNSSGKNPFDFFLISTEAGDQWVDRYETLVSEL